MERLTYRDSKGKAWAELDAFADAEMQMKFGRVALNRLTSYEDTGLMPDEIPHWVPVSEKMPLYNHPVLAYNPSCATPVEVAEYCGYYGEDDEEWHEHWIARSDGITHWMPLPQPPKG